MAFQLPPLPYAKDALAPQMSAETLEIHHGKHHKAYVDKLNELVAGSPLENKSLEEIIRATAKDTAKTPIFNNAAQAWNHDFFWHSMKPKGGGKPTGDLLARFDKDLGGFDKFRDSFKETAVGQFGSGWAWLILEGNTIKIAKTSNADNPIAQNQIPLLACDVWEHAYYVDYRNRRPDFITAFLDHLIDWDFVAKNLTKRPGQKAA